jgi:heme iron utilization protein
MSLGHLAHHAEGESESHRPAVPEPTYAERARTLLHVGRVGSLATLSHRHPGWPFSSVMPYALDAPGRPIFLISDLAVHTQNLRDDPRASLLVTQHDESGDPLGGSRVTIMGRVEPVPNAEIAENRQRYLTRYENARYWVDFRDFTFTRLEVRDVYFVGGFGVMGWVTAEEYARAVPDPLVDAAPGILEHMNADHADALLLLAHVFGGVDADAAEMTAVDRLGFHVRLKVKNQVQGIRIPFVREVKSTPETRAVLVEMVRDARQQS